jgi:hypothetical protein
MVHDVPRVVVQEGDVVVDPSQLADAWLKANLQVTLCRRSTRWLGRNEQSRYYRHHSRKIFRHRRIK